MGLDLDERHRSSVFSLLHQGSEARPRIQFCVAGVSDVVARVLLAHPVRRQYVCHDRRLEFSFIDLLKPSKPAEAFGRSLVRVQPLAVRSGRRLPSVHMFSNLGCALPCFSSSYFSIVSQSAIRGGLKRAVPRPARRFRLGEEGAAEEPLISVLDGFHSGKEEQLLALSFVQQAGVKPCPAWVRRIGSSRDTGSDRRVRIARRGASSSFRFPGSPSAVQACALGVWVGRVRYWHPVLQEVLRLILVKLPGRPSARAACPPSSWGSARGSVSLGALMYKSCQHRAWALLP
eukprot:tig00000310_g23978.t1